MSLEEITFYLKSFYRYPQDWYGLWQDDLVHLLPDWESGFPFFHILIHDEFCEYKDLKLAMLRNEVPPEEFVFKALQLTGGCRFIIFEVCPEEFIQFWVYKGQCVLSFPIVKENNLEKHLDKFLKILEEMGIEQDEYFDDEDPWPDTFSVVVTEKMIDYKVNFTHISPRVAEFTNRMVLEVYEDDLENLRASVG